MILIVYYAAKIMIISDIKPVITFFNTDLTSIKIRLWNAVSSFQIWREFLSHHFWLDVIQLIFNILLWNVTRWIEFHRVPEFALLSRRSHQEPDIHSVVLHWLSVERIERQMTFQFIRLRCFKIILCFHILFFICLMLQR